MLVQVRDNETWLIRQHDHGLLAGELALHWGSSSFSRPEPHHLVVMAVSMHDVGWHAVDEYPLLNPATGLPHTVFDYPMEPRPDFFARGLDRSEHLHPYVALLDSLHYTSFPFMSDQVAFQGGEARRQRRVRSPLLDSGAFAADGGLDRSAPLHLEFLRMMDRLSLHVCNMLPGSLRLNVPAYQDSEEVWAVWNGSLDEQLFTRAPSTPHIGPLELRWEGDRRLALDPFPFAEPFTATIPFHRLPGTRFENASELRAAWLEGEPSEFSVTMAAPGG